jgi:hypothetical protein
MKFKNLSIVWLPLLALCFAACEREKKSNSPETSGNRNIREVKIDSRAKETTNALDSQSKRMPKRHSKQIEHFEEPNPVRDMLIREFAGNLSESQFSEKAKRLWNLKLSELPENLLAPPPNKGELSDSEAFLSRRLTDIINGSPGGAPQSQNQIFLNGIAAIVAERSCDQLQDFAAVRRDSLPPTEADLSVFQALWDAFGNVKSSTSYMEFELWADYHASKNPVYRLLALKASLHSASSQAAELSPEDKRFNLVDAPAKYEFYAKYMDELDPAILAMALKCMGTNPLPEARETIKSMLNKFQTTGDAFLAESAERALTMSYASRGEKYIPSP